jgi:hypothetical protein
MKKKIGLIALMITTLLFSSFFSGCVEEKEPTEIEEEKMEKIRKVLKRCGEGYLEEDLQGNLILHLKGSPYKMGYQEGVLCREGVEKMTHDYINNLLPALLGIDFGPLWPVVRNFLLKQCLANEKYIPEEYRLEMQGLADGAGDNVTYEDVLLLNEGIDVLLGIAYPLVVFSPLGKVIGSSMFKKSQKYLSEEPPCIDSSSPSTSFRFSSPAACNEFAVFGEGTTDGRLFHGRDFMFNAAGGLHDYALVRVAEPNEGYPFIGVTAPGFVGIWEGMNVKGISCGINTAPASDCAFLKAGESVLFVCRDVVQYSSTLEKGIGKIRAAPKYVPWIYVVSDGKIPDAAVIEASLHSFEIRMAGDKYPGQVEEKPCLVEATNHYIHPKMRYEDKGTLYYGIVTMFGGGLESEWRYNYMCNQLLQNYSKIDTNIAREIIDFLHPPNYDYLTFECHQLTYTDNPSQAINGSISLFDPIKLEIWSLYGYYDSPWVHYDLKEELK